VPIGSRSCARQKLILANQSTKTIVTPTNYSDNQSIQPARAGTSPGASVRIGTRQSIPSHSIDNCGGVSSAAPSRVSGQTKRPRSNRFA